MNSERESRIPRPAWVLAAGGNRVAARRGGKQPEAERTARTKVNPIRCEQGASLLVKGEACDLGRKRGTALSMSKSGPTSLLVWLGRAVREGIMWKIRELPVYRTEFMAEGPEEPAGSSQSVHSSNEAGNDRGAKGRREEKP